MTTKPEHLSINPTPIAQPPAPAERFNGHHPGLGTGRRAGWAANTPFYIFLIFNMVVNLVLASLPPSVAQAADGTTATNVNINSDSRPDQNWPQSVPQVNSALTRIIIEGLQPIFEATKGKAAIPDQAQLKAKLDQLPLSFEVNQNQTDPQVKFLAHGRGYNLFLTDDKLVIGLQKANPQKANSNNQNPQCGTTTNGNNSSNSSQATFG